MTTSNIFAGWIRRYFPKSAGAFLLFGLCTPAFAKDATRNAKEVAENALHHPRGDPLSTLRVSLQVTSSKGVPQGREFHFIRLDRMKKRGAIRVEIVPQGERRAAEVYGFDGQLGWQITGGKVAATLAGRAQDVLLPFQAPSLLAEIADGKKKTSCKKGSKHIQLEMLCADGRKLRLHLDRSGSLFRMDLENRNRTSAHQFETIEIRWRQMQDIWVPFEVLQSNENGNIRRLTIEHVDVNQPLNERFVSAPYALMSQTPTQL
ncbi:MAG: hypothetical protein GY822_31335 [Deltaproteobacteria bacterium]|nr:hypothetical protein [Deltaproteobacteria bacterium]